MQTLGNVLWFILGGMIAGLAWWIVGAVWCITIIGIPIGLQAFKLGKMAFFPFGKTVVAGGGAGSLILNILWLIFGGLELAFVYVCAAAATAITIIGIPFAIQYIKLARLALFPFGASVENA